MLRIAILGAGRMGHELLRAIAVANDARLAGVWVRRDGQIAAAELEEHGQVVVSTSLAAVLQTADLAIDFTLPEATAEVLAAVEAAAVPLVSGVTGLRESELARLQEVARTVPVLVDRNMSLGVAVLKDLARQAAQRLGPQFVVDVREAHHRHKKDAPSGTALALGETVAAARQRDFAEVFRYDPDGGARRETPEDIVFAVTRRDEVPGEHTVAFRSDTECLELTHKVSDRRVFADGALRAALWLAGQQPGLYRMSDVLADFSR